VLPDQREARLAFVMRWQQVTGPIVAKGIEDTALYVYHPLLSLNEVGGDPEPTQASSDQDFFSFLENRRRDWPHSLNSTTTHDTKRSEGVRARINVLSEMANEWRTRLELWAKLNERHKQEVEGRLTPDRNEEYFFYQTLIGVWPLEHEVCETLVKRLQDYLVKATREAMVHTRWTRPNQRHEEALQNFVARVLSHDAEDFLRDFRPFQQKLAYYGMVNSLSQILLKIASPGVADFYQGSELWELRLVDPDNRGPVDFSRRMTMLDEVDRNRSADRNKLVGELVDHWHDGRIKLFLIQTALCYRRENATLFQEGEFVPLPSTGARSHSVVSFLRRHNGRQVLAAVPRWLSQISEPSATSRVGTQEDDTEIQLPPSSPSSWNNLLTGETVHSQQKSGQHCLRVDALFRNFPVALLNSAT
jgi:(1->4)-alpha-D-glucan 1-alpha-D-glucosylmutase